MTNVHFVLYRLKLSRCFGFFFIQICDVRLKWLIAS